ncbi:hypothetical protein [Staphylococcus pseudintermedius]|uniref:hypothetical protein n=1 Tax=Staphylococcus pseudintermedius TaxID=283734 RepID=UPI00165556F3|nr:hypothetical protein [Staphylococcus pseudintermedius]EII2116480.1 hypothetical protein [Staphylococcus pseudintermedius]EJG1234062.1 hypothetical protein [Staphylococcus pseudintermedius]EKI4498767.1 hypothetical protein [Staphylococcus pseudintermedius]EKO1102131.1 hypothetical protein [Staphylococcus pseudintermedius]EKO1114598.1 hypothetical protein [Staphylococcus pseudintermedius]
MATFEVLKDCRDKKAKHLYRKDEKIEATVKAINDFERRLKKAGYELPFFKRIDN